MKNYTVICDRGDIVIATFPFSDIPVSKRRPVVVLSKRDPFNQATDQMVCAMITGARKSAWPFDTPITDLETAGVRGPSVVRLKIFTLDQRMIDVKCGSLSEIDLAQVTSCLGQMVGTSSDAT